LGDTIILGFKLECFYVFGMIEWFIMMYYVMENAPDFRSHRKRERQREREKDLLWIHEWNT